MKNEDLIEELMRCTAICEHCADACLHEEHVHTMVECIQLNRDCAEVCRLVANMLSRDSARVVPFLDECALLCKLCAKECGNHEEEHCKQCAEVCERCAAACRSFHLARV